MSPQFSSKLTKVPRGVAYSAPTFYVFSLLISNLITQRNSTYPFNSAHWFIVYLHEKLLYVFNSLEREKKICRWHRSKVFTRLLGERMQKERKSRFFQFMNFVLKCTILEDLWNACSKIFIGRLVGVQCADPKTLSPWDTGAPRTSSFETKPQVAKRALGLSVPVLPGSPISPWSVPARRLDYV